MNIAATESFKTCIYRKGECGWPKSGSEYLDHKR